MSYADGAYWANRKDMMYYQYLKVLVQCLGVDAKSILDVGSGNAPYLDWFDWIPEKASADLKTPYRSQSVRGIVGNILELEFEDRFDLCTCFQVLEHVPQPHNFARRLLELGNMVLISVPYKWPKGATSGHINDPVDKALLDRWFGRKPNYTVLVHEPFGSSKTKGVRLFALYDVNNPDRKFGTGWWNKRKRLDVSR